MRSTTPRTRSSAPLRVAVRGAGLLGLGLSSACLHAPTLPEAARRLPTRVRRLSNIELERSADRVLGVATRLATELPPDLRQHGYTINSGQSLSVVAAARLARIAPALAERSIAEGGPWPACLHEARPAEDCRDTFVSEAGRRAFRRPLEPDEHTALAHMWDESTSHGASPSEAGAFVLSTLLQSPQFLYLSELGVPRPGTGLVELTPHETASALSYTVWGGPPDADLLDAAERGDLSDGAERIRQARRLLGRSESRHHFRQFVLEWLEVDRLEQTAKAPAQHPLYDEAKGHMLAETRDFVDEVMVHWGGSFRVLLAGGFTSLDATMARYYGVSARSVGPRVSLASQGRVGLLQQASFLSAHAHPDSSSPVQRGDFVLRKLLCVQLPRPSELDIEVTIPAVSEDTTTRRRFEAHTADPECSACHDAIDPLGMTFESFDGGGRVRELEHGTPIDTSADYVMGDLHIALEDSEALSQWLAESPQAHHCFARQALRYFTGQADSDVEHTFDRWVSAVDLGDPDQNLVDLLLRYVGSELFVTREAS